MKKEVERLYDEMTDENKIEKELFDKVMKMEHDFFILRVCVSVAPQKLKNRRKYSKNSDISSNQIILTVQISNKILHWNESK